MSRARIERNDWTGYRRLWLILFFLGQVGAILFMAPWFPPAAGLMAMAGTWVIALTHFVNGRQ